MKLLRSPMSRLMAVRAAAGCVHRDVQDTLCDRQLVHVPYLWHCHCKGPQPRSNPNHAREIASGYRLRTYRRLPEQEYSPVARIPQVREAEETKPSPEAAEAVWGEGRGRNSADGTDTRLLRRGSAATISGQSGWRSKTSTVSPLGGSMAGDSASVWRLSGGLGRRQIDGEGRAAAGCALDGDAAAVRMHQLPGDGQSQPAARAACMAARPVAAPEAIEDERQILGRDPLAGVADRDPGAVRAVRKPGRLGPRVIEPPCGV